MFRWVREKSCMRRRAALSREQTRRSWDRFRQQKDEASGQPQAERAPVSPPASPRAGSAQAQGSLNPTAPHTSHQPHVSPHTCFPKNIRGISPQPPAPTFVAAMVMSATEKPINNTLCHTLAPYGPLLFHLPLSRHFPGQAREAWQPAGSSQAP